VKIRHALVFSPQVSHIFSLPKLLRCYFPASILNVNHISITHILVLVEIRLNKDGFIDEKLLNVKHGDFFMV
jgi:hypothetical protein